MAKRSNGFEKDPNRASEAGKKSKRGPSMTTRLQELLDHPIPKSERIKKLERQLGLKRRKREMADGIEMVLLDLAMGGSIVAIKEIHERIDGKAKQLVEHSNKDDKPFELITRRLK